MKLFRLMFWSIAAVSGCVALTGCAPGSMDLSDLQPEVSASGGGQQVQRTRIPIDVEVTVSETGGAAVSSCRCLLCGCTTDDPFAADTPAITEPRQSSGRQPQRPSDTRPVVFWVSDFGPGECSACEAVAASYQASGAGWPFRLEQRPRSESPVPVQASPTFYWRDSDGDWRYFATGSSDYLVSVWRNSR